MLPVVFDVTVKTSDTGGNWFHFPELEEGADTVTYLYHQHGTSEQFHGEVKTAMDVERFPFGRFSTNALDLQLAMLGYNCLGTIGQQLLGLRRMSLGKLEVSVGG